MTKCVRGFASLALALSLGLAMLAGLARADLKTGTPDIGSAGSLTFGPDGLLFLGDSQGAAVFAIDTGDRGPRPANDTPVNCEAIDQKVADLLGTTPQNLMINDLAVNPASGRVYLSVSRGKGPDAQPALVRLSAEGSLQLVELDGISFDKASLPNAPEANAAPARPGQPGPRAEAITDLAFVDGRLFIAGLSNEEFASRLVAIPYPFKNDETQSTSVEIFHGAHGRFETRSPVRTFVPYEINGKPHLLAAYTCTPLVRFPIDELKPGSHVKGVTIAELGNRNRPLDMIAYTSEGRPFLLMANSSRGVMKIPASEVGSAGGIVQPVKTEREGVAYETIDGLKGVLHLDKMGESHAVLLSQDDQGRMSLQTIELP